MGVHYSHYTDPHVMIMSTQAKCSASKNLALQSLGYHCNVPQGTTRLQHVAALRTCPAAQKNHAS